MAATAGPDQGGPGADGLFELTALGDGVFRGFCQSGAPGRAFGGHLSALGLAAAQAGVADTFSPNSIHAGFLAPARPDEPVDFTVSAVRDGRSFVTRQVLATQEDRAVLSMLASFHVAEPSPEFDMPETEADAYPDDVAAWESDPWPPRGALDLPAPPAFGLLSTRVAPRVRPSSRLQALMKPVGRKPDDLVRWPNWLIYMADWMLPRVAVQPITATPMTDFLMASIDLTMWFHRPADLSDWIHLDGHANVIADSRALARIEMRGRGGDLVATVVQEVLVRPQHGHWPQQS